MPFDPMEQSKWKQLGALTMESYLDNEASIKKIAELLAEFYPPSLEEVTVQFRAASMLILSAASLDNPDEYIDTCLKLDSAMSKFRRKQLSFLVPSQFRPRKLLWTRELGQLFPSLRDLHGLLISCESCERFYQFHRV